MKLHHALTVLTLSLLSHSAQASEASPQACAELNAYLARPGLPNVVCVSRPAGNREGTAKVSLYREGTLIAELSGEWQLQPGGSGCNRHTGDCHSYPPYLAAIAEDRRFAVKLAGPRDLSGTVTSKAHSDFVQYTMGTTRHPAQ